MLIVFVASSFCLLFVLGLLCVLLCCDWLGLVVFVCVCFAFIDLVSLF